METAAAAAVLELVRRAGSVVRWQHHIVDWGSTDMVEWDQSGKIRRVVVTALFVRGLDSIQSGAAKWSVSVVAFVELCLC